MRRRTLLRDVNDELRVVVQNGTNCTRLRSEVAVGWVGQVNVKHLVAFQGVVDDHANEDVLHQLWRERDRAGLVFEVFSHQRSAFDRFKVDRHLLIVGCIGRRISSLKLALNVLSRDVLSPTN